MDTTTGYVPKIGDRVWQQMYCPQPHASITERIAHGRTYGGRRQMIVVAIVERYQETNRTRWQLLPLDPADRRGEFPWSLVESDWCVLTPDDTHQQPALF